MEMWPVLTNTLRRVPEIKASQTTGNSSLLNSVMNSPESQIVRSADTPVVIKGASTLMTPV
jgi:hypothetical protein